MTQSNYIISKVSTITTAFVNILTYGVPSNTFYKLMQNKELIAIPVSAVSEKNPKPEKIQVNKNILGLGLQKIQQIQQIQESRIHELFRRNYRSQLLPLSLSAALASRETSSAVNIKWVLPGSSVFDPPEGTRGGITRVSFFANEVFCYV